MTTTTPPDPLALPDELALYSVEDVCRVLDCGRTAFYALVGSGRLRSVKVGRHRKVLRRDLEAFLRDQAAGQ